MQDSPRSKWLRCSPLPPPSSPNRDFGDGEGVSLNSSTSPGSTESPSVSSRIGKGKNQDHNRGIAVAPSGVTVAGPSGLYHPHPIAQWLSTLSPAPNCPRNGFQFPNQIGSQKVSTPRRFKPSWRPSRSARSHRRSESRNPMQRTSAQADTARIRGTGSILARLAGISEGVSGLKNVRYILLACYHEQYQKQESYRGTNCSSGRNSGSDCFAFSPSLLRMFWSRWRCRRKGWSDSTP